jgi:hypothetical protein
MRVVLAFLVPHLGAITKVIFPFHMFVVYILILTKVHYLHILVFIKVRFSHLGLHQGSCFHISAFIEVY